MEAYAHCLALFAFSRLLSLPDNMAPTQCIMGTETTPCKYWDKTGAVSILYPACVWMDDCDRDVLLCCVCACVDGDCV